MDNNFEKTLSEFRKRLSESQSILKYSLYLPDVRYNDDIKSKHIDVNEFSRLIESVFNDILSNCSYLFNHYDTNVFGYKNDNCTDLSLLSMHTDFWKHIFKQDAILSAFIKLRKLIGESHHLSYYEQVKLTNFTNPDAFSDEFDNCRHGLDYLLGSNPNQKKYINFEINDSGYTLKKDFKFDNNAIYASKSSNSKRRILNIHQKMLNTFNTDLLYFNPTLNPSPNALHVLEFNDHIVSRRDKTTETDDNIIAIINSHKQGNAFTKANFESYASCVHRLFGSLPIPGIISKNSKHKQSLEHKLALSDRIYVRYQLERVFAPTSIDCMYQNIVNTIDTPYALDDQATIHLLSSILALPNVFTRQYIFQMAIDTISKHNDYNFSDSYFFTKYREDVTSLLTQAHVRSNHLQQQYKLSIWLNRYCDFINYLGHFIFPIYESYFFCSLWKCMQRIYSEQTDAQLILTLYDLLRDFFNDENKVERLFASEKIILSSKENHYLLKPEHIVRSDFSCTSTKSINLELYKKCLLSHNLNHNTTKGSVPDFINMDYLTSLVEEPAKHIQAFYIAGLVK